jgi:hypothetical protein
MAKNFKRMVVSKIDDQTVTRIEWSEVRDDEPIQVIADLTSKGWEFWEKSGWEARWYPMAITPRVKAKLQRDLNIIAQSYKAA